VNCGTKEKADKSRKWANVIIYIIRMDIVTASFNAKNEMLKFYFAYQITNIVEQNIQK